MISACINDEVETDVAVVADGVDVGVDVGVRC